MKKDNKHKEHCHEDGSPGMSHGSADDFLKRFWIVTILLIPLIMTNQTIVNLIGFEIIPFSNIVAPIIATIIFAFAFVFFQHAWMEIKMRKPGMMVLVSMAVLSGYIFSITAFFVPSLNIQFYIEISTLIWVLLFGHYLEAKSGAAAGNALSEVAKLLPTIAHRIKDGKEQDVQIEELIVGDIIIVKPGEKIPADGIIIKGSGNINESLISGESKPILKSENSEVYAGSLVVDSAITIELTKVGDDSTVGQIKNLIIEAQKTKPRSQKLADKAAGVLTYVAGITALLTLLIWALILGQSFVFAMTLAITVLVIACPHALGLAIPTVTTISTTLATRYGFFIKNLSKIEIIKKANVVVFDKTGTLTEGIFGVSKIITLSTKSDVELLTIAASLESSSSHLIAKSILEKAQKDNINLAEIKNFKNIAGKGVSADINNTTYYVGNESLMHQINVSAKRQKDKIGTYVFIAEDNKLLGYIILADSIKKESAEAVKKIKELGLKVVMLTGDNQEVADEISNKLKIDKVFGNVLPADKLKHIKDLQEDGNIVIMVGDGVNDAPALTQANVGIAIGAGTDVAVEAGDVVLLHNNPRDIPRLIILSRAIYAKMKQNLIWALGYNIIAIPAAAGVFAFIGFFLRHEVGTVIMSLSTVIIVANAMLLKRIKL